MNPKILKIPQLYYYNMSPVYFVNILNRSYLLQHRSITWLIRSKLYNAEPAGWLRTAHIMQRVYFIKALRKMLSLVIFIIFYAK